MPRIKAGMKVVYVCGMCGTPLTREDSKRIHLCAVCSPVCSRCEQHVAKVMLPDKVCLDCYDAEIRNLRKVYKRKRDAFAQTVKAVTSYFRKASRKIVPDEEIIESAPAFSPESAIEAENIRQAF